MQNQTHVDDFPQIKTTKGTINETKFNLSLGRIATIVSVMMYVSYIPQIMDNLAGHPGNPTQPLVAFLNSSLWVAYGSTKKHRDWPVVIANLPGIVLSAVTFFTSF
jgi:uncharacterized protein with PQ loop repeat